MLDHNEMSSVLAELAIVASLSVAFGKKSSERIKPRLDLSAATEPLSDNTATGHAWSYSGRRSSFEAVVGTPSQVFARV
jgi:hypothetical protein